MRLKSSAILIVPDYDFTTGLKLRYLALIGSFVLSLNPDT
jgi:hypothetical protein